MGDQESKVDVKEFKRDFLDNVRAEAAVTGEGSCAMFVSNMAGYLIESEIVADYVPSFYEGVGKRGKKYRVDGYSFDEFDKTMNLFIALFDGIEEISLTKTLVKQIVGRIKYFAELAITTQLYKEIEISSSCSDLVDLLHSKNTDIRRFRIFVFTDGITSSSIKTIDNETIEGITAEVQVWDVDRVFAVCTSENNEEVITVDFTEFITDGIPCIEANNAGADQYKGYLCVIPGEVLADIYDRYGSQLLENNVRSFLSTKVAVNKKIRETIRTQPTMFFAYNNGISATAMDVKFAKNGEGLRLLEARNFQIINGGQTTASLSNTRYKDKADLSQIFVQMKLTEIGEMSEDNATELVQNISRSSNSQNKVSEADFFATHPFHIRIEQFSRRILAPNTEGNQYNTKWFYERAKGQYLQLQMRLTTARKNQFALQNPKAQVITKTDLAKFRNSWDEMPHFVSKGAQTNFMKYAELINEQWESDNSVFNERYYKESIALAILFKHLERMVPKQPWYEQGYRANIVTYSIALLHRLIKQKYSGMDLNLMLLWNKQCVPSEIDTALIEITKSVFEAITDENRPVINVTQWCKQELCWENIKKISIDLSSDIERLLLSKDEKKQAEKAAKKDQVILSGIEAQTKVIEYSGEQWRKAMEFSLKHKLCSPDELSALKVATKIPNKVPEDFQCQRLLALVDKLVAEGFSF